MMSRFSQLETGRKPPTAPPTGESTPEASAIPAASPKATEPAGAAPVTQPDPVPGKRRLEMAGAGTNPGVETKGSPASRHDADAAPSLSSPADDAPATLIQAEQAYYVGDWDRALRLYSRALQLNASLVRPWVGQVYALLRKRQDGEAMTWVNRALERFPEDPSLLSVRGLVYAAKGMHQRALGSSDYAIGVGSTREAWLARGEILLQAGSANAGPCFDKALEIDPGNALSHTHIGMAYLDHRHWGNALEHFEKAAEKDSKNYYLWLQIGRCAERMRFLDRARSAYERATQLQPTNRDAASALEKMLSGNPISRLFRRLRRD